VGELTPSEPAAIHWSGARRATAGGGSGTVGTLVDVNDGTMEFEQAIPDDELAELALAADPAAPLPDDAIPIGVHLSQFAAPLPLWYMPPVGSSSARSGGRGWKLPIVLAVVSAFLLIDALGLCNTYGILSLA
jgi:hypothetical protein